MKFIWKIENFSRLKCEQFQSPTFSLHSAQLELVIYPNFEEPEGNIRVELQSLTAVIDSLNYSVSLLDYEGSPFAMIDFTDDYDEEEDDDYDDDEDEDDETEEDMSACLIKRKDLFGSKKTEYLPNDVLTVQCCIWETIDELSRPLSIFARSRIESAKVIKKFSCNIPEENLLVQEGNLLDHVEPLLNGESLHVKLYLTERKKFQFEFNICMLKCKIDVEICLLDTIKGKKVMFSHKLCDFTIREQWVTGTKISRSMIMSHQNVFLSNNTLPLEFVCSFSENVTLNRIVEENEILNQVSEAPTELHSSNTISQVLQEVLKEGLLSDFNLRAGDRLFPVHKVILSARSQVFRVMFTTEMREKEDNCVDIPDVDEGTLQRLLQFVYADKFEEDMGWQRASGLYAAADKYAIEPLKQECSAILKSEFCVSNVLEVLAMADLHRDQELKLEALDFILFNDKEIIGTGSWMELEKENSQLALETCRELYLKKINN